MAQVNLEDVATKDDIAKLRANLADWIVLIAAIQVATLIIVVIFVR